MLRLVVNDEDMFGDPNFVGQCSYPVRFFESAIIRNMSLTDGFLCLAQLNCLRKGYRSVQLLNGFSEEIELATLLVNFQVLAS